ncbi:cache domain-containing sensor histidine kinase [Cohnella caldifontis]|uniref:cache domain-containing sensor histidine kinase n=1 Tax=Cohnella caldifontis TaxID=3027471 RepID=UPI0023ECA0F8|nr:sensor histidine kinase [Cohnella sp. YIM B05605]
MRGKSGRYRTKLLVLFILLSCVPALLIGTTAYRKSSDMFHAQTEQDLSVILDQMTTSVERQINDFDRFTMLPYYMPGIFQFLNQPPVSKENWGSAEIVAQRTMARLMSAYPSINSSIKGLTVYGMNGSINGYRISGNETINPDADVKAESWYRQVLERKGGFVITGVQEITQFKGAPFPAIIGSRLLMDDDYRPLAVIAMFISPEFIPKIVRSLELPGVQVTVLDRNGMLVYASDDRVADSVLAAPKAEKKGTWEMKALPGGGPAYLGVFKTSEYLGWKVYMGINRDEMLQGSRSIREFTLAIVVAVSFAAAVVSWLLARSLSKPIHRLIRSMRDVEKGQFQVPFTFERVDEIGLLERSYGKMVHRLDELIQSIEEKERQKRHAELYALRARIQPHFLYNTLNSIRMLAILQQSAQIAKLLQSLSKLLQANMRLEDDLVPLAKEIGLLKDYAALMDLRYTNVFDIEWRIDPSVQQAAVPPMLLQPLLENAIFHGGKGLERKLRIIVAAVRTDENRLLVIEVADDGAGFHPGTELESLEDRERKPSHIGLRNVRDRIRLRFGEDYGLQAARRGDWTCVTLRMPLKGIEGEEDGDVELASG